MLSWNVALKTPQTVYHYVPNLSYKEVTEGVMNRLIMLGNWKVGKCLIAAIIVESLLHSELVLVRYCTCLHSEFSCLPNNFLSS